MTIAETLQDRRGVGAVEFALIAPLFIGLTFAAIDGGMLIWTQVGMEHAVESAARCAAVGAATCKSAKAIENYAASQAYGLIPTVISSDRRGPNRAYRLIG